MAPINKALRVMYLGQWILIGGALATGITAVGLGISDNPPGIISLMIAITCLVWAWVWNWSSPRRFWILLGSSLLAFPVGVVLHNLLYALGTLVSDIKILASLLGFLEVFFFLLAVMLAGPTALVALLGGIYTSWSGMAGLTRKNRCYRRFKQAHSISNKKLRKLIFLTRMSASGANLQPLKFILSNTEDSNQKIFPTLSWAGYLKEWSGPEEGEKPAAYIILLGDTELAKSFQYDAGIASQSITLGAAEMGLGACLIGSIKRDTLRTVLNIPEQYEILLVIALGKPAEQVVIDDLRENNEIKYWRDGKDVHHVPKRNLADLILEV